MSMCKEPEWLRAANAGLRQKADLEFVIDLRDGLRLFETRSGAQPFWPKDCGSEGRARMTILM